MNTHTRRRFLTQSATLAATGGLALSQPAWATGLAGSDYRALVCLFLYGGNDGNNTVVPMDTAGYAAYAKARGMTDIAKAAGITREALYKALRPGSAPRFDTVNRVCAALGVRLVAQPLHPV